MSPMPTARALAWCAGAYVALAWLPWALSEYHTHVATIALYYVILATGWNLLAGYTGQFSLAHHTFAGIGAYTSANGKWKGELVNREHTPAKGERPVFGGHEVGIGFSGTYDGEGAEGEATALAGKRSIRFKAVLRKLVDAEG